MTLVDTSESAIIVIVTIPFLQWRIDNNVHLETNSHMVTTTLNYKVSDNLPAYVHNWLHNYSGVLACGMDGRPFLFPWSRTTIVLNIGIERQKTTCKERKRPLAAKDLFFDSRTQGREKENTRRKNRRTQNKASSSSSSSRGLCSLLQRQLHKTTVATLE